METHKGNAFPDTFPHLILENFYNEEELNLVWEELKFILNQENFLNQKTLEE